MDAQGRQTSSLGPRTCAKASALRGLGILAAAITLSSAFAPSASAQGIFTWEGVERSAYPAPQDGVTVATNTGGQFGATDERAGNSGNQISGAPALNCNHTPGGSECGYNGHAQNTSIYSINPATTFTLNSGYFTRSAVSGADFLHVIGQNGTTTLFDQYYSLSDTFSLITFNWAGVNNVIFGPCKYLNPGDTSVSAANCYGGASPREGGYGLFLADDISFNQPSSAAPEPSEMALLGTGLIGLFPVLRRRKILG